MTEPAERLRHAADLLEQRAKAATPGPWARLRPGSPAVSALLPAGEPGRYLDGRTEFVSVCRVRTWEGTGEFVRRRSGRDLDWIALMGPEVAVPLAALLREEADGTEALAELTGKPEDVNPTALALADVILDACSE